MSTKIESPVKLNYSLAGIIGLVLGAVIYPKAFWSSYSFGLFFWTGIGTGCLGLFMLHNVVGGRWGVPVRRLFEAGAWTLVPAALFFIPLLFNLDAIFPWASPEAANDALIQKKVAYLNVPFFTIRWAIYFGVWSFFVILLSRWSIEEDKNPAIGDRMKVLSAPGLIFYVLTVTFFSFDWMMSLEPHWFSSIYGTMMMVQFGLFALVFCASVALRQIRDGLIPESVGGEKPRHDLGNLIFAFVLLNAYMVFSQTLIIWSGQLHEETVWYAARSSSLWKVVLVSGTLLNFILPFFYLLIRENKRDRNRLRLILPVLMMGGVIQYAWVVFPGLFGSSIRGSMACVFMFLGFGSLFKAAARYFSAGKPLIPLSRIPTEDSHD